VATEVFGVQCAADVAILGRMVTHSEVSFKPGLPHSELENCWEILPSPVTGYSNFELQALKVDPNGRTDRSSG
jgi:hypothetical protein